MAIKVTKFGAAERTVTKPFSLEGFVAALESQEELDRGAMAPSAELQDVPGMESFDKVSMSTAQALNDLYDDLGHEMEALGLEAYAKSSHIDARVLGNMTQAAKQTAAYLNSKRGVSQYFETLRGVSRKMAVTSGDTIAVEHLMDGPYGTIPSLENYDEKPTRGYRVLSIAYNLGAARQDPFGEALFPTLVVNPTEGGIVQEMNYTTIQPDVKHGRDGTPFDPKEVNLVEAYRNSDLLRDESTRIIPVLDERNAKAVASFVDAKLVPPTKIETPFGELTTAPYRIGTEIDLIGLSQRSVASAADLFDQTDTIDPALSLESVYVSIDGKVVRLLTRDLPESKFGAPQAGDSRLSSLQFQNTSILVTNQTKAVDGTVVPAFAKLADKEVAEIKIGVFGQVSLRNGNGNFAGTGNRLLSVTDAAGTSRSITSGVGAELATSVAQGNIVGFTLNARLTNKNRRERGQLAFTRTYRFVHQIPMGAPITTPHSTLDELNKDKIVNTLVVATNVRNSNNAVTKLLNTADQLRASTAHNVVFRDGVHTVEGALGKLIRPTYRSQVVDLRSSLNSIRGQDKFNDIAETLLNAIKAQLFPAYRDSNIEAAFRTVSGNPDERPKVIIATDNEIAHYLMQNGDNRTLGAYLKYEIVSTNNKDMDGKIIAVLTRETPVEGDVLNFGQFLYVPSLVADLPISRGGQVSTELAVIPFNLHITNIPFLIEIDVLGLGEAMSNATWNGLSKPAGQDGTNSNTAAPKTNTADQGQTNQPKADGGKTN